MQRCMSHSPFKVQQCITVQALRLLLIPRKQRQGSCIRVQSPNERKAVLCQAVSQDLETGGRNTRNEGKASRNRGNSTDFGFPKNFSELYNLKKVVGSGSFGTVWEASKNGTPERFAVKVVKKRFGPNGSLESFFKRRVQHEIDIYNHVGRSLNVAYLYAAYEDAKSVYMVLELCTGGDLWSRLRRETYTEKDASVLVREVLRVVAQCHARHVILRDVKPENFLFLGPEHDAPLKAIDFGLATYCDPGQRLTDRAGTAIYIAPEVLKMSYGLSADVWSAGIVAYQLLTGRLPFAGEDGREVSETYMQRQVYENKEVFRAVLSAPLDFESPPWDRLSEAARELVSSMLQRDPALRPTAAEALHHRWLQEEHGSGADELGHSIVQRLQRFGTYGRLKQAALRRVAHHIAADSELVRDLREMFQRLDTRGTGRVQYAQLQEALDAGHFSLSGTEAQQLMAALVDEMDASGEVDYDGWVAAMGDWRALQESEEWEAWMLRAFEAFDVDGSGRIGFDDLQEMLCGEVCQVADTIPAALREADRDNDGSISLAEFEQLLRSGEEETLDLFESRLP